MWQTWNHQDAAGGSINSQTHAHTDTDTHMHAHIRVHVRAHTQTHTNTHTRVYTRDKHNSKKIVTTYFNTFSLLCRSLV